MNRMIKSHPKQRDEYLVRTQRDSPKLKLEPRCQESWDIKLELLNLLQTMT